MFIRKHFHEYNRDFNVRMLANFQADRTILVSILQIRKFAIHLIVCCLLCIYSYTYLVPDCVEFKTIFQLF